jgi:hypothetical protein
MSEKYIDNIVDDIYGIITKRGKWPFSFNADDKIKFLKTIQSFYVKKDTHEGYARCAKIQKMIGILEAYNAQISMKSSGSIDLSEN